MADTTDSLGIEMGEGDGIATQRAARSPRTHVDSAPLPTDSMVTVPLSEAGTQPDDDDEGESVARPRIIVGDRRDSSRPNSVEILQAFGRRRSEDSIGGSEADSPTGSVVDADARSSTGRLPRSRRRSNGSDESEQVDWAELERKEEQEPEGEGQDKVRIMKCNQREDVNFRRQWHYCSPD